EPGGRNRRRNIGSLLDQPVAGEAGDDATTDQADQQQQDGNAEPVAELRSVRQPERGSMHQDVGPQQTRQRSASPRRGRLRETANRAPRRDRTKRRRQQHTDASDGPEQNQSRQRSAL